MNIRAIGLKVRPFAVTMPTRTTAVVADLPQPAFLVEIECDAWL